jgi:hypothetical protein
LGEVELPEDVAVAGTRAGDDGRRDPAIGSPLLAGEEDLLLGAEPRGSVVEGRLIGKISRAEPVEISINRSVRPSLVG